jgi:hypothetical protein
VKSTGVGTGVVAGVVVGAFATIAIALITYRAARPRIIAAAATYVQNHAIQSLDPTIQAAISAVGGADAFNTLAANATSYALDQGLPQ